MRKEYDFVVLALLLMIGIIASGCTEKSDSPSEVSASEVTQEQFPIPIVGAEKTEFTAADVIQMKRGGEEVPMGEFYDWGTGGIYFFGTVSQVENVVYEGTGFIVTISDESISVFPTSTKIRVSSVKAFDTEKNKIESTSRNIFNEGGVIISSRRELLGNTKYLTIGFEPT